MPTAAQSNSPSLLRVSGNSYSSKISEAEFKRKTALQHLSNCTGASVHNAGLQQPVFRKKIATSLVLTKSTCLRCKRTLPRQVSFCAHCGWRSETTLASELAANPEGALGASNRERNNATYIFTHIGKTAGTTLRNLLISQDGNSHMYLVNGKMDLWLAALKSLNPEALSHYKYISGHVPFGLHEMLPLPARYLTILRDPIDRALSEYYYILQTKTHPAHEFIISRGLPIEAVLDAEFPFVFHNFDNLQTRMLAGAKFDDVPVGKCTREMLETAKLNIDTYYDFVGIQEQFDASLFLLNRLLGLNLSYFINYLDNVTASRPEVAEVSSLVRHRIALSNRLDIELYEYALARLKGQLEPFCTPTESPATELPATHCYLDFLGPYQSPWTNQPYSVDGKMRYLSLGGWAVDPKSNLPMHSLHARISRHEIFTNYHLRREDVAESIGSTDCLNCGFRSNIPIKLLERGEHTLELYALSHDQRSSYRFPVKPKIIVV